MSNCCSRGSLPDFLKKPITTCGFPGGGSGPPAPPPGSPMLSCKFIVCCCPHCVLDIDVHSSCVMISLRKGLFYRTFFLVFHACFYRYLVFSLFLCQIQFIMYGENGAAEDLCARTDSSEYALFTFAASNKLTFSVSMCIPYADPERWGQDVRTPPCPLKSHKNIVFLSIIGQDP